MINKWLNWKQLLKLSRLTHVTDHVSPQNMSLRWYRGSHIRVCFGCLNCKLIMESIALQCVQAQDITLHSKSYTVYDIPYDMVHMILIISYLWFSCEFILDVKILWNNEFWLVQIIFSCSAKFLITFEILFHLGCQLPLFCPLSYPYIDLTSAPPFGIFATQVTRILKS